jgi:hypothetical protein
LSNYGFSRIPFNKSTSTTKDLSLYLEDGVEATLEELTIGISKHSVEGVR